MAAAALSADRTLRLTRNLLTDRPDTLRIEGLTGKADSLLNAKGHLFVLTSDSMVILPNLASRFLEAESLERPMKFRQMPIKAVDVFLAYDKVFIVLPEEVQAFDIDQLVSSMEWMSRPASSQSPLETSIESHWKIQIPIHNDNQTELSRPFDFASAES